MSNIFDITSILHRPEHDILFHSMLDSTEADSNSLVINSKDIDWNYLLSIAENHGLTPLLHQFLNNHYRANTPKEILEILHDRYSANELRNRILTQELCSLTELLSLNGIRALAYKGPSLTLTAYSDIGLRQFGDLDILISKDEVPKACELLINEGYNRTIPPLSPTKEQDFIRTDHEHEFISPDQLVHVDLHWELSSRRFPFQLEPNGLFERAESISLSAGNIEQISAQDMLLLLCMHSNKDLWRKLIWICDIDRMVRANKRIDWDWLLKQSKSSHCFRMLHLSLFISNKLLKTPVPDLLLQSASKQELIKLYQRALQLSLQDKITDKNYLQCLAIQPFILSICDSYTDRFRYTVRTLDTVNSLAFDLTTITGLNPNAPSIELSVNDDLQIKSGVICFRVSAYSPSSVSNHDAHRYKSAANP